MHFVATVLIPYVKTHYQLESNTFILDVGRMERIYLEKKNYITFVV